MIIQAIPLCASCPVQPHPYHHPADPGLRWHRHDGAAGATWSGLPEGVFPSDLLGACHKSLPRYKSLAVCLASLVTCGQVKETCAKQAFWPSTLGIHIGYALDMALDPSHALDMPLDVLLGHTMRTPDSCYILVSVFAKSCHFGRDNCQRTRIWIWAKYCLV